MEKIKQNKKVKQTHFEISRTVVGAELQLRNPRRLRAKVKMNWQKIYVVIFFIFCQVIVSGFFCKTVR